MKKIRNKKKFNTGCVIINVFFAIIVGTIVLTLSCMIAFLSLQTLSSPCTTEECSDVFFKIWFYGGVIGGPIVWISSILGFLLFEESDLWIGNCKNKRKKSKIQMTGCKDI